MKGKLVTVLILVFPELGKEFDVHMDASSISLGTVSVQLGEGNIDHAIELSIQNILTTKEIYNTTKQE